MVLVVKNPPANAGDTGGTGSISGLGRSPEKEMATHSSILAWKIPRTEEAGGLQSKWSQRVGHNRSDLACMHILNPVTLPYCLPLSELILQLGKDEPEM